MFRVCSTTVQDNKKSLTALRKKIYIYFFSEPKNCIFSKAYRTIFHGQWQSNCCDIYISGNATVNSWSSSKCSQTEQDLLCKESLDDKEFEGKIGNGQILYNNAGNMWVLSSSKVHSFQQFFFLELVSHLFGGESTASSRGSQLHLTKTAL